MLVHGAGYSESRCLCGGNGFLLVPGNPSGHSSMALIRTHRAVEALDKSASNRGAEAKAAELMPVRIAVREAGKARRDVSFPAHREDEGELIDRAWEIHVPERAR